MAQAIPAVNASITVPCASAADLNPGQKRRADLYAPQSAHALIPRQTNDSVFVWQYQQGVL
jgi:hypothetical protein